MPLVKREPVRGVVNNGRNVGPGPNINNARGGIRTTGVSTGTSPVLDMSAQMSAHEGIRQSLQTLHLSISTGSNDLDKLLGHGGLPLGHILLIEEEGITDFSSVLLRSYASQGIVHARLSNKSAPTEVVVVGMPDTWIRDLPGVYKDRKEKARDKLEAEKSVLAELSDSKGTRNTANSSNMKIAWRYGAANNVDSKDAANPASVRTPKNLYSNQFDFTSRMMPAPSPTEIKCIAIQNNSLLTDSIIQSIESSAKQAYSQKSVLRVVIPSILHPMVYSSTNATSVVALKFMHQLHKLCRRYPHNLSVVISISLALYPNREPLTRWMEHFSDGVIHLEPRNDLFEVVAGSNAGNRDESTKKPYQGFVHIRKLPVFSERGINVARQSENVFRVGKRSFDITEWTIPVEDADEPSNQQSLDF